VHLADYAEAVGPTTGMVLKVHPSNFLVTGFTSQVSVTALAGLGAPVVVDIGSGLLRPTALLPDEPDATTALRDGAALVTASGDKLLGGPQCGLLLGGGELVHRLRRHPLARALRVDKLTLAALEATVRGPLPPVLTMLEASLESVRRRADVLGEQLAAAGIDVSVETSQATVGGGGAPGVDLPSVALALPPVYARLLREGRPAVLGRLDRGRCLLDLRSLLPADDAELAGAVVAAARQAPSRLDG
jgi:L-seryl-tRNA(Ser) seleniumtransferase